MGVTCKPVRRAAAAAVGGSSVAWQGGNDDNGLGERKIVSQSKIYARDTP
jgi:hypothetical protein